MESEIHRIHRDFKEGRISCTDFVGMKLEELAKSPGNTANFLLGDTALESAGKVDQNVKKYFRQNE